MKTDNFVKSHWRPAAAVIYLIICIFDFIIMPIYTFEDATESKDMFSHVYELETYQAQVAAIGALSELRGREWSPLTLGGGGMFHLAFGALLTGAAVTRGLEKKAHLHTSGRDSDQF